MGCPWNSLGQNTRVGSFSLLQGIFPTQGSNPGLPHYRGIFTNWVIKEVLLPCCCCCCRQVASVVSNSVRPRRRQPTRLLRRWDSPGKNTGVGCHFLLQCMKKWKVKVKLFSRVWLLATPWTAAHQFLCPWDFPGKSTGVGCQCPLLGITKLLPKWLYLLTFYQYFRGICLFF